MLSLAKRKAPVGVSFVSPDGKGAYKLSPKEVMEAINPTESASGR
jgi:hypothetical protein